MKLRVFIFLAIALCARATEVPEKETADAAAHSNDKRQAQEGSYAVQYRQARKQEPVAPVEELQDDDKLRNQTSSLQPISEDQSSMVERPPREQPVASSTEQSTTVSGSGPTESDQEIQNLVNVEVVGDQSLNQPISIEHRSLSLEDRRQSHLPPPQDGKSYTPEEFTSLVVSGFAVTPVPDYGVGLPNPNLISPVASVAPPPPLHPHASLPIFNPNVPLPGGLPPPALLALREQALRLERARLLGHYRQSLHTLPPPKNHKFYTPEEYNTLLAAGYPITAVPVNALTYGEPQPSRSGAEEYRPGQVYSLNPHELLELQPERKAPITSGQLLQQLYASPQQEHKQNLQQIYYLDPEQQTGRQVPPSHTVIARPHFNFNGGEASVGAALSVSDTGASSAHTYDQELLAFLGQPQVRPESHAQAYSPAPQHVQSSTVRSVAPQYQQVDRYVPKPSKKASKHRSKVHVSFPQQQPTEAPEQYLIETTNVQQQQQPQQQQQQQQYRPTPQPQRLAQALRYVPITQQAQAQPEFAYERPEAQGLKIVPAPKLQQLRPQNFRVATPQYQQQEASPKQYRIVEVPQQLRPQAIRQELRLPSSNIERPVAYLKRYPELEKQRSVKIYDPVAENGAQQQVQLYGEQFVLRPVYRTNEQQRHRYELPAKSERVEPTKPPHSAIYVSKNLPAPRKIRLQPQPDYREQADIEQINIEQHGRNLDEQRSNLPPPKNNKAYTPEEFAALVAAGYSVTPVPVSAANLDGAQSRIEESVTPQPKRRLTQRRRNQYLPVRDDAP